MKKAKRVLSFVLAALMLTVMCPCFSITAFADTAEPEYTIIQSDPDEITPNNCIEYLEGIDFDIEGLRQTMIDGISQCTKHIEIPSDNATSNSKTCDAINAYFRHYIPDYACLVQGAAYISDNKIYYTCVYSEECNTPEKLRSEHTKITAVAEKLLQNIKGNDSLTDVEKALLVHDRLAAHIDYDFVHLGDNIDWQSHNLYGALINRRAVCEGYSKAYSYLMNILGIKTFYVVSYKLNHAWNVTYINNKPYYVDVTWDDPSYALDGYVEHTNFLRSFEGILETGHIPDNNEIDYPVSVNGTEINDTAYDDYYWQASDAEFRLVDDTVYYINNAEGTINKADEKHTVLYTIPDEWSPYYYCKSRLSSLSKDLLFSESDKIYKYDTETGEVSTVFTPNKTLYEKIEDDYSIFGFKYEDEYLYCYVYNSVYCPEGKSDYLIKQRYTGEPIPQRRYSVTVAFDDSMGTVTGAGTYTEGTRVTLKAQSKLGYVFNGFYINGAPIEGGGDKTAAEITVNSDMNITAGFDKCGHSHMTSSVTPAGCLENGYTQHVCSDCGYSYRSDETPAYGSHNYEGGVCTRCGKSHPDYLESEHPYKNNSNETKTLYKKGADHIAVTFSDDTNVEKIFDYIIVSDGGDNVIGKYTGKESAGKRITVAGDTVKITLKSDASGTEYGYRLSDVEVFYEVCAHTDTLTETRGAKTPTCSAKGYSGDVYCLECGRVAEKGKELPYDADNHTDMYEWTYESNCTYEGYTLHYCPDCDYEYKTDIVPVNGKHKYQNGFCIYCRAIDESYIFTELDGSCTKELTLEEYEEFSFLFKPNQNGTIRFTVSDPENIEYYALCGDFIVASRTDDSRYATGEVEAGESYYLSLCNQTGDNKAVTLSFEFIPDESGKTQPDSTEPVETTPDVTEPVETQPAEKDISDWTVKGLTDKTYNGRFIKPAFDVVSDDGDYADFDVEYKNNKKVGTATVIITGTGDYTGTITTTFKILKAKNPITVKANAKTVKLRDAKKKNVTVKKAITVKKNKGALSYTRMSGSKYLSISKKGVITVKKYKKFKKNQTLSIKVKVTAKGSANYKSGFKTVTVKIKVK